MCSLYRACGHGSCTVDLHHATWNPGDFVKVFIVSMLDHISSFPYKHSELQTCLLLLNLKIPRGSHVTCFPDVHCTCTCKIHWKWKSSQYYTGVYKLTYCWTSSKETLIVNLKIMIYSTTWNHCNICHICHTRMCILPQNRVASLKRPAVLIYILSSKLAFGDLLKTCKQTIFDRMYSNFTCNFSIWPRFQGF